MNVAERVPGVPTEEAKEERLDPTFIHPHARKAIDAALRLKDDPNRNPKIHIVHHPEANGVERVILTYPVNVGHFDDRQERIITAKTVRRLSPMTEPTGQLIVKTRHPQEGADSNLFNTLSAINIVYGFFEELGSPLPEPNRQN